ncbi:hypothetical protein Cgig2_016580 [Carnegiea gigantea]|uniref:Peptidase A1 domain-containing protein n=1 Tax=Carnegiea gigantea TaxID=171969 RepID=A0A9Q1KYF5_9CARY|nr:hypothetical protein Cgig2_016580 [Carnegiea gigantea]
MACSLLLSLSFLLLCIVSDSASSTKLLLPIVKDDTKTQYFTSFLVGAPKPTRVYLAVDLSNLWSWFTCDIYGYKSSSTFKNVDCDSPKCATYGGIGCVSCTSGPPTPSCTNNSCGADAYSPWSNMLYSGGLVGDTISLYTLQAQNPAQISKASLRDFPFTCADKGPLKGLSPYTKGILTLARRPVALHAHISSAFKVPHKFALCLPASSASIAGYNGAVYFGGGPYYLPPTSRIDLSRSLVTTPIVVNPNSTAPIYTVGDPSIEYFINVRSIKVDGTPVRFRSSLSFDKDGVGGTKISTMDPYTVLHSETYKALTGVFVSKATTMKITRVASVAPFGACFDAQTIANTKTGPGVPIIDLILDGKSPVLHNKNARWRIYGANSMVKVSNKVLCLGFVDGGSSPRTSIVIGGKQMEDNLVEIDLEANKLGQ